MRNKKSIQVVHSIPGRARLRFSPESPELNLDSVLQISGVEKATFSNITKSLLIIYDNKMTLEDILLEIKEKMSQIVIPGKALQAHGTTEDAASANPLFPFSLIALGSVVLLGIDPPTMPAYALMWAAYLYSKKLTARRFTRS